MHILLIHQNFTSLEEAGGTRHAEFARLLAARGHQVTVITSPVSYLTGTSAATPIPSSATNENGEGGIRILYAATYRLIHRSFIRRVLAFFSFMISSFFLGLGVRNVDVVWGTSPPIFQGFTAWLLARLKRLPFLFEVRDLWPSFAIAVGVLKSPVLIRLSLWLEGFLYRHADRVVVNSPGFITHVSARGARRVTLIPNSANPEMFNPEDEGRPFRAANHLENEFVVLYAGAHGMSNDLGVVLQAAGLLQQEPEAAMTRFVLLGDGKEKSALQAQAARLGLANILFLPPIPKTGMAQALAGADACLAILKPLEEYKTTYPNKVFDYMAAGRPILLAIDGVIREVVEAAGCGIFVQPGSPSVLAQAVRTLYADGKAARAMGLRGRQYLEQHFDREQIASRLEKVLMEMASGEEK
jgi:glycosyltransferase involved in cell wall biosynthesis